MAVEPGTGRYRIGVITFSAQKGKSVDLAKIQTALQNTRLGRGTKSGVNYFDITAKGEVVVGEKETLLKVSGATQEFALGEDPKAKPKEGAKTPFQRLREALANGEKVASVTGRVDGWNGRWPEVLKKLSEEAGKDSEKSEKPTAGRPRLFVTDFETVKK
jgi:hypothetical protein